jgi:hypothetical protein
MLLEHEKELLELRKRLERGKPDDGGLDGVLGSGEPKG